MIDCFVLLIVLDMCRLWWFVCCEFGFVVWLLRLCRVLLFYRFFWLAVFICWYCICRVWFRGCLAFMDFGFWLCLGCGFLVCLNWLCGLFTITVLLRDV